MSASTTRGETRGPDPPDPDGMAILSRAIEGDEACREKLIGLMRDPEVGSTVVDFFGNLPRYAELATVAEVAGEGPQGPLVNKAVREKLSSLRAELAGPDPTAIERLLAERAAYCWLVLWKYEHHLANAKDLPSGREEFHHRRIAAAHRRYLSSLRTLAQVRKLAVPDVRVTIGPNPVNVAAASASAAGGDTRNALRIGPG